FSPPLSLHDALPICRPVSYLPRRRHRFAAQGVSSGARLRIPDETRSQLTEQAYPKLALPGGQPGKRLFQEVGGLRVHPAGEVRRFSKVKSRPGEEDRVAARARAAGCLPQCGAGRFPVGRPPFGLTEGKIQLPSKLFVATSKLLQGLQRTPVVKSRLLEGK